MFEKLFGNPKTPEDAEKLVYKQIRSELSRGVNGPAIQMAFEAAKRINTERNLNLTNNHLLNLTREAAVLMIEAPEIFMQGGEENTDNLINFEIENLRRGLSEEEQGR